MLLFTFGLVLFEGCNKDVCVNVGEFKLPSQKVAKIIHVDFLFYFPSRYTCLEWNAIILDILKNIFCMHGILYFPKCAVYNRLLGWVLYPIMQSSWFNLSISMTIEDPFLLLFLLISKMLWHFTLNFILFFTIVI